MKRPSLQFYPADWQANSNLRRCTHEEKGIWLDVMCLFHDQEEYGICRWPLEEIALAVSCTVEKLEGLIAKGILKGNHTRLETAFVYIPRSGRRNGDPVTLIEEQDGPIWYSSRMVRDEYVRQNTGKKTRFKSKTDTPPNTPDSPDTSPSQRQGEGEGEYQGDDRGEYCGEGQGDGSTSTSSSTSTNNNNTQKKSGMDVPREAKQKRRRRIPDDFTLTDERRQKAIRFWEGSNRPDLITQVELVFEKFLAHHRGKGQPYLDWESVWKTWYVNALQFERSGYENGSRGAGQTKLSTVARNRQLAEQRRRDREADQGGARADHGASVGADG